MNNAPKTLTVKAAETLVKHAGLARVTVEVLTKAGAFLNAFMGTIN
jgi:hypothetical protein